MTTIRQLIKTSPVKANELFAKLVDTSEAAVKTRDRLFSELKDELELQAELQEQHLFPVLKKHKETKDLVAGALNDNRETRKLMADLEKIPKDSEEFGTKVAEIHKVFQQHVRGEKKEFLPAVVKALSDEEASTVVERIEDEKAQIEAAQRAEAKREREQAEAAKAKHERERAQAEAAKAKVKTDAERVQAADIAEAGAKVAQQGTKVARMVTRADADGASETDTASAGSSMVALLNEQTRHAMQATMAVGRARTLTEVTKAQSDFIGGSFQRMGQFNERYLAFVRGGMVSFPSARR